MVTQLSTSKTQYLSAYYLSTIADIYASQLYSLYYHIDLSHRCNCLWPPPSEGDIVPHLIFP